MNPEILPCPYCGAPETVLRKRFDFYFLRRREYVECTYCHVKVPEFGCVSPVPRWNRVSKIHFLHDRKEK